MRAFILTAALLTSIAAHAEKLPFGSFRLAKGFAGCSREIAIEPNNACQGFILRDLSEKTHLELCNIDMGKYINRRTEEGLLILTESRTNQNASLVVHSQTTHVKKGKESLRKSKIDLSLYFRGGRLELQQTKGPKTSHCLYSRDTGRAISAGLALD